MPSWFRLDADFPSNPKIAMLSDDAFRVYVTLACYCAQHDTDGRVSGAHVDATAALNAARVRPRTRHRRVNELVASALVVRDGQDYVLPGYLERNPSREQVEQLRGRWRAAQQAVRDRANVIGGQEEASSVESSPNVSYRFVSRGSTSNNAHLVGPEPVDKSEPHARERLSEEELAAARQTIKERRR